MSRLEPTDSSQLAQAFSATPPTRRRFVVFAQNDPHTLRSTDVTGIKMCQVTQKFKILRQIGSSFGNDL